MTPFKRLVFAAIFILITACGNNQATPENIEMECADMERTERERCLEYHNGSYDQYQREKLNKQG
mgnify:CR=1 FL=1|jgi:hypothetical protein